MPLIRRADPARNDSACDSGRRDFLRSIGQGACATILASALPTSPSQARGETGDKASSLPTGLATSDVCRLHDTGREHPECSERYTAVHAALRKTDFFPALKPLGPRVASYEEVRLCHPDSYVRLAQKEIEQGNDRLSTGDTVICRSSMSAALHATGAACAAVDAVMKSQVKNAFCIVRPPGHHATPEKGMGFCVFNNVAIAARYAQKHHGIGKVLIVDWDVHHGNGTQDIFYEDDSVFFFSTHQAPWYPWSGAREETGTGRGLGSNMNRPFPAGAGRKELLGAFESELLPAMNRFKPELVLISAGFDSRHDDPLGQFTLTDEDFVDLTTLMLSLAREHAGGRLVSVLEGGYNISGLASAATAHCRRLQQRA